MDTLNVRQKSGKLSLVEVYFKTVTKEGKTSKERRVQLRCTCGATFSMSLSKWTNQPAEQCQKCAIAGLKRQGFHGFGPRLRR